MAGLVGTGISYENNALSGFVRLSAEQKRIDEANRNIKAAEHAQTMQMIGQGLGIGAMLLFMAL